MPEPSSALPADLSTAVALAQLLDQLDHRPRGADAAQYRAVARGLARELARWDGDMLEPLLRASPAACEVYENTHYLHAGLCRSDLDLSLQAELLTRDALRRAASHLPAGSQG
ncbi:MAG: hypothetical protein QM742_17620 [Aquabacterium sp.]